MNRIKEPSTWAGLGLVCHALSLLMASGGKDGAAWGQLVAGVVAVAAKEAKAQ